MASQASRRTPPNAPALGWQHMAAVPDLADSSITRLLDAFITQNAGIPKSTLLLRYLHNLPQDSQLAQLQMAQMTYLHFKEQECKLMYDAESEVWYVFEKRWLISKGKLTRVKALLQSEFLPEVWQATWESLKQL